MVLNLVSRSFMSVSTTDELNVWFYLGRKKKDFVENCEKLLFHVVSHPKTQACLSNPIYVATIRQTAIQTIWEGVSQNNMTHRKQYISIYDIQKYGSFEKKILTSDSSWKLLQIQFLRTEICLPAYLRALCYRYNQALSCNNTVYSIRGTKRMHELIVSSL